MKKEEKKQRRDLIRLNIVILEENYSDYLIIISFIYLIKLHSN